MNQQKEEEIGLQLKQIFSLNLAEELHSLERDTQRSYVIDEDIQVTYLLTDLRSTKRYSSSTQKHKEKKERLAGMRGINHMAIEQHEALEVEFEDKRSQREDIHQSVSS